MWRYSSCLLLGIKKKKRLLKEENAHSAQGTCLLLNRSDFEAFFSFKVLWQNKHNTRGGRRKLLLLKGCVSLVQGC